VGDVANLGRLLSDTARRLPGRPALVWRDRIWTWREIDARVNAFVAALKSLGVGKGHRVLVQARNSNAMFESCWAAFKLGAVWVPTNYRLTPPEIAWLGQSSGAVAFLYDRGFGEHVDAVRSASPALRHAIAIDRGRASTATRRCSRGIRARRAGKRTSPTTIRSGSFSRQGRPASPRPPC
jgi:acyl-CoA synthetase (AMP-forming)/AMP-acid ligase II